MGVPVVRCPGCSWLILLESVWAHHGAMCSACEIDRRVNSGCPSCSRSCTQLLFKDPARIVDEPRKSIAFINFIRQTMNSHAVKIVVTAGVYWFVWFTLIAHGPMKKLGAGVFSADARLPLAFILLGTSILLIWTWRKLGEISRNIGGLSDEFKAERSWTGAKWLGVLAWLAIGMFIMVFPTLFLGSTSLDPIFVGAGVFALAIALWVAVNGNDRPRDADYSGIDFDLDDIDLDP